jgi:hypothetical protein
MYDEAQKIGIDDWVRLCRISLAVSDGSVVL